MARWRGLSVVFHVFYLNLMPFSMPRKLQKGLFFSPVSPNLGRVTRPMYPISLPSTPQNSTSAPLFRCPEPPFLIPQTTIWDVPFCLLGYPILPFGVSHFAIWGIPFRHLGYIFGTFAHNVQPRFSVCLLRFRCKSLCVSLLSVHHVFHDSFGWISQFL